MQQEEFDGIIEAVDAPFFLKDTFLTRILTFLCKIIMIVKFLYSKFSDKLKFALGLPLFLFGWKTYLFYGIFVIWTKILDQKYTYDFSGKNFSLKSYFNVLLLRILLFIITGLMMDCYYAAPLGLIGFIYAVPMAFVSVGYSVPVFEYRLSRMK